jgi:uncharacterized membrane protein (UPF0127 family)
MGNGGASGILIAGLCAGLTFGPAFAACTPDVVDIRGTFGQARFSVEVADTGEERAQGLMFRESLPKSGGMLFVYGAPQRASFWMKNTPLPLTAAFVADDGTIVNLADMKPHTTDSHCSAKPVRFVLEMNQGWFAKRAVRAGFRLTGKPFDPPTK